MAYEIIGETIKSATSIKLGQIFPNSKRYKENITKPTYPSFWIIEVNKSINPAGTRGQRVSISNNDRVSIEYLINIQYRVAENTETITNLRQELDEVGLKLCTELDEIDLELPVKTYNRNYEIVDGVGQFTFNVRVFATLDIQDLQMMGNYNLEENIDEEED